MTDLTFEIKNIFPGTPKQVAANIHATFNLTMSDADGILVQANDMKLMKSKEGKWFIGSPYKSYEGKDKEGNAATRRLDYVKFFPEQKNWSKQDNIIKLVLSELEGAKNNKTANTKPQTKPAVASKPPANEPW